MAGPTPVTDRSLVALSKASDRRRFSRLWGVMVGVFLGGGLLVLLAFGLWSWQDTRVKLQAEIAGEAKLVADGVEAYLTGLGDDLPYLGEWLKAGPHTQAQMYRFLRSYQEHHPNVASVVLFAPDGRMLLNTAEPLKAKLPDPREHPAFVDSIRATLHTNGIWVGKTQRGLVLKFWRIPVRYVVRSPGGKPEYILQASLPLARLVQEWPGLRHLHNGAIGLIRADGLHVARLPEPDPERLYSHVMTGPLMQALREHPDARRGGYDGKVQSDFTRRIGRYVRLRHFPLVAYISIPTTTVWTAWMRSTAPFFALGLLGLAGYVGLAGLFVRRERRHLDELALRARREPVTGLPNRLAAHEWLEEALAKGSALGLLLLNLDDFNDINDALGGSAGDQVLKLVARRLRSGVKDETALLVHLGGDEFLIGLPQTDPAAAQELARRLQRGVSEPIGVGERTVRVRASVGIGLYPDDGQTPTDLMRAAATAVHVAKRSGRGRIAFYDPGASRQSEVRVIFHHAVERALAQKEFVLYYQPVVALDSGELKGAEALIRWQDPERGLLGPGQFIPLAEATGWIGAIGNWVLRQACDDLRAWLIEDIDLRLSINVSAIQFNDNEFVSNLERELDTARVPADRMILELTETTVMQDVQHSVQVMRKLIGTGVGLAIDDFGTGYSSLAYLRRLPVHAIKIDREFVSQIESDPEGLAIVRAVVALARVFGCVTVAEGIETENQYRLLKGVGVDFGQGFLFGRPIPEEEFRALAVKGGTLRAASSR
ncbi:MAG TPA: EAL domain-containing protein [Gammaproteobacteria bacterium]|nr:EAL domain-containing protein [Gammaproteobacteria bacterium]